MTFVFAAENEAGLPLSCPEAITPLHDPPLPAQVYTGGLSSFSLFHLVAAFFASEGGVSPGEDTPRATRQPSAAGGLFPYFVNGALVAPRDPGEGNAQIASGEKRHAQSATREGDADCEEARNLGGSLVSLLTLYGGLGAYRVVEHAVHPTKGVVARTQTRLTYPMNHNRSRQSGDPLIHPKLSNLDLGPWTVDPKS